MSVTSRTASKNPNDFPSANVTDNMPKGSGAQVNSADDEDYDL